MMTKRMTAMPTERSQLSNQRPSRDWRFSKGAIGSDALRALEPARGAPKSCMPFTLPTPHAGRNGNRPSAGRAPAPYPIAERVRRVAMHYSGRQARRFTLALDADPRHRDVAQRSEEHTSELQSQSNLVCRLLLEKKTSNNQLRLALPRLPHHLVVVDVHRLSRHAVACYRV